MGEHETWFHLLPGMDTLVHRLGETFGAGVLSGQHAHGLHHVIMAVFVFIVVIGVALRYRGHLAAAGDGGVVPETRLNARSVVEIITDAAMGMMSGVMGEEAAKRFLPLIGSLAFFILFSNMMGLFPGFLPATDTVSTTLACATVVFVATHIYGLRQHGVAYLKHFLGPVIWLAPLMLPIELVSHLARPLSLSLRLAGNMIGDHKVLSIFLALVPLLIPVPILVLGIIVAVVQTLVFCMLSVVYIALAIEESH